MTVTSERPGQRSQPTEPARRRHPSVAAVVAALQSSVAGLLLVIVPALAIWMATPRVAVPWPDSVKVAVNVWLLGHGAPLSLAAGQTDVVPLGLLMPLLWLCWSGGLRVVRAVEAQGLRHPRALAGPAGLYVGCYGLLATVLAAVVGSEAVRASLGAVLLCTMLVSGAGLGFASASLWLPKRPELARVALLIRGAGVALLGWFGLALVVLVAAVGFGFDRIADVQQALHPGGLGHVLLVLLQLVLVPTAWVWSASYVTGAGFSVGEGTSVSPFGTELAPVPALPLLGALPEPGTHPVQAVMLPLLVVTAAGLAGYWVRERRGPDLRRVEKVADAVLLALLAAGAGGLLAALSSGAVGPGRMAEVGPGVVWLSLVAFVELLIGALLGVFAGPAIASGRAGALLASVSRQIGGRGGEHARRLFGRAREVAGTGLNVAAGRARDLGSSATGRGGDYARSVRDRISRGRRDPSP